MKKLTTATDLGGAPITKNDLREVFNSEIWAAIQALLSPYDADSQGIVVSGCVTTANVGNFDMTAGIVYLNGEFMRIAAATNQTFTKYIAPKAVINDTRTFADTTTHVVTIDKQAELVSSSPGAGQYITISSLTDLDDRRWTPASNQGLAVVSGGSWITTALANTDVQNGSGTNSTSIGSSNVHYRIGEKETFINLRIINVVFAGTPSEVWVIAPTAIRNILNQELRPGGNIYAITGTVNSTSGDIIPCQVLYDGTSKLKFFPIAGGFGAASLNNVCCDIVSRFVS